MFLELEWVYDLKSKVIFYSFREVRLLQSSSRTLLTDMQRLRNTYCSLKDDLAFDVVRPGLGHPSLFAAYLLLVVGIFNQERRFSVN